MPLKYWDEAFLAATYLINRTPAKNLQFSTPLEVLFKEKPDYSMLRVFGCACWPNLRPYNAHKLAFCSKRCVFLGYNNMHKGFKCLDISTGRIYISRDVVFDEQNFPFADLHANAGARLRSEIELLSPTLFDSSIIYGSTTISSTDMPNGSINPVPNPAQNPEEIPGETPVSHVDIQGETGARSQVDPPAAAPNGPLEPWAASTSASAGPSEAATCLEEELSTSSHVQAVDTEATRLASTGSGAQRPDTNDTRCPLTGSVAGDQPTASVPVPGLPAAGAAGSGASSRSSAPPSAVTPLHLQHHYELHNLSRTHVHKLGFINQNSTPTVLSGMG
jgi:hypothetical protein